MRSLAVLARLVLFAMLSQADVTASSFTAAEGIAISEVAANPDIAQPVYITFDERGRLWVVQYLQYPFPEGLKIAGHDHYWRVRYENWPPPPPPHGPAGRDRVTILEDRDGDGKFESAKDFITGLNIATAALPGKGGVWVLNPPYLLFYPDADADDIPDGAPIVHLAGFGLEDMHAVANSLMWGPDGWLYGCQGSTCTAAITLPGSDAPPVEFKGQAIWRYQPERKAFELFAEGGYNNFGIAMDPAGRMYTGSNGGLIGVHYVQGGYYWKNWGKHGPHSNPYTFGHLSAMKDRSSRAKLSQAMLWYERGPLPARYDGQLLVARVMQYRIDACALTPDASTFAAEELGPIVATEDIQFRPVDLKIGPDAAVYVADWFDTNVTWQVSAEHQGADRDTGRIFRLGAPESKGFAPFDLRNETTEALTRHLLAGDLWHRHMALRLLRERGDSSAIAPLCAHFLDAASAKPLEALWALFTLGGFDLEVATFGLGHSNPDVRRWVVRLLGDGDPRYDAVIAASQPQLVALARAEEHPEVLVQIAATARRLSPVPFPLLEALTTRNELAEDPHYPLFAWWYVENALRVARGDALSWILAQVDWSGRLFREAALGRVAQRFTLARSSEDLEACSALLARAANSEEREYVLAGMEQGLRGNPVEEPPARLVAQVEALLIDGAPSSKLLNVAMQLGVPRAAPIAREALESGMLLLEDRRAVLGALARTADPEALPHLLRLLADGPGPDDRAAALDGLQHYRGEQVQAALIRAMSHLDRALGDRALSLLARQPMSARALLDAVEVGEILPRRVGLDIVNALHALDDETISKRAAALWGSTRQSPEELQQRMQATRDILDTAAGEGDAARGKVIYAESCGKCHQFFGEGREVGPDLTGLERSNRDFLIEAIVDPSAAVLPEYMAVSFTLSAPDEFGASTRQVLGFLLEEDAQTVTIVDSGGNSFVVPPADVMAREPMPLSLMPTGLLDAMTPQEIRDLFAYLQART